MPSLNKVLLMGNITRDPELRVTPKGTPICQFSLAINRSFKMESGETREEVIYVDVEAWGKQGETIAKYCSKGRPLYVEGRLKLDQWDDKKTGEKRSRMKVVLEAFQFLGDGKGAAPKSDAPKDDPKKSPYENAADKERGGAKPASTDDDPDVPF